MLENCEDEKKNIVGKFWHFTAGDEDVASTLRKNLPKDMMRLLIVL